MIFNLLVTPVFWSVTAPKLNDYFWKMDIVAQIQHFTLHLLPILSSTYNYIFTKDLVILPEDWKLPLIIMISYMVVNYVQTRTI